MPLNDIFPQVSIEENSLYLFMAIVLVSMVLCYLLYRFLKHQYINHYRPLKILKNHNPKDAKLTAHQVSYYGKILAKSEPQKALLASLEEKLEAYKYLQTSPSLPPILEKEIELFVKSLRHKNG